MNILPRKRKSILALGLACIGLILGVLFWARASGDKVLLKINYVGDRGWSADRKLTSFEIVNEGEMRIYYRAAIEVNQSGQWPVYPAGTILPHGAWPETMIEATQTNTITIEAPANSQLWRVSIVVRCEDNKYDEFFAAIRRFLVNNDVEFLARLFAYRKQGYAFYGPEMRKRELE